MLNSKQIRELCYIVKIDEIKPIEGRDRVECAMVGGWSVMVRKNQFKAGDLGVYFEIDSKTPETAPFEFLEPKHYKIKTQKFAIKDAEGNKLSQFWSQGLLMGFEDFVIDGVAPGWLTEIQKYSEEEILTTDRRFLTKELGVKYSIKEDNRRKSSVDKYKTMAQRHANLFKKKPFRWLMKRTWGKKLLFVFFGKKRDNQKAFPTHFQYVKKTDAERVENMTWVLQDKSEFIRTQKCDGSSATYILERKPFGRFEFYVCSRNVRMLNDKQECFHTSEDTPDNVYWGMANKYDIENKLKDYLKKNPDLSYVCWQGEICAPNIQKNPHRLKTPHLYCFHMIDSKVGKYDIRTAKTIWEEYNMEVVPIDEELYILPDDLEAFKESAEGCYDPSVCEGNDECPREGYVYYKADDPNFHFKNVARSYLLRN